MTAETPTPIQPKADPKAAEPKAEGKAEAAAEGAKAAERKAAEAEPKDASQLQLVPRANRTIELPVFKGGHCQLDGEELSFFEAVLRMVENDSSLTLQSVQVAPGCKVGDNYATVVTRNTALGRRGDGTAVQRSVIVKHAPQRDQFRGLAAFAKETEAYTMLVPALRRVCRRAGLPLPVARCLHASRTVRPDLIVLEDLAPLGFSMRPRQQGMDGAHAMLIMEALGRFHGASLALRRVDPLTHSEMRTSTKELMFFPEARDVFTDTLEASTMLAALSLRQSGREDLARRLEERASRVGVFQDMCEAVLPPPEEDVALGGVPSVFTHGDCWSNNLLFRYNEDGSPCETRIVDLAAIRCSSPALDLMHFLNTSLPRHVRSSSRLQFYNKYLDTLRDTVTAVVQASGTGAAAGDPSPQDAAAPLTLAQLEREMHKRAPFGLWIGMWMMPAIYMNPSLLPKQPETSKADPHADDDVEAAEAEAEAAAEPPVDHFSAEAQAAMCKAMPEAFHKRMVDLVEEHVEDGTL